MSILRRLIAAVGLVLVAVAPASAQDGRYRVQPGDVINLEVLEDESFNRSLLVLPDGTVSVPLAGSVAAGGRTLGQIRSDITAALDPNFAVTPTVFVGISQLAPPPELPDLPDVEMPVTSVYILGEAANTGLLEVRPGSTLLEVFSQMGGFTEFAATRRVQLRRADPATRQERIYLLNYDAIMAGRSPNGRIQVMEGDVILVPERGLFE